MNRQIIFGLILLTLIGVVGATIVEKNSFKEEILYANGTEALTGATLNGVSVLGYLCNSINCSTSLGGIIFNNNSGVNNWIDLGYPNNLPAGILGYGLYFYKPGYLPYEAFVDYTYSGAGNVNVADADVFLAKMNLCVANVSDLSVYQNLGSVYVNFTINSPINNSGPLNIIPTLLADYYATNVSFNVSLSNGTVLLDKIYYDTLPFSNQIKLSNERFNGISGEVNVSVESYVVSGACLTTAKDQKIKNISIIPDTTPPSLPTGLHVIDRGTTYITWAWTNPTEGDFLNNHVLLNGSHVATVFGNSYNATGLIPNTAYVIALHPVDNSGNMNMIGIANINSTLPLGGNESNVTNGTISLAIISPINKTYTNKTILINISSINATNIWYNFNGGANWTYTSPIEYNLGDGIYVLNVYGNNTNYSAYANVSFSVNSSGNGNETGEISLHIWSPINGTVYNVSSVLVNITAENATNIYYKMIYNNLTDGLGTWSPYNGPFVDMQMPDGNYELWAFANNSQHSAKIGVYFSINYSSGNDTTGPGPIQNLTLIDRGQSYLTWNWTNPNDSDFSYVIIYIDGRIVTGSIYNSYNITGLKPDTVHTIMICTVDTNDNIDYGNCVSGTGRTLPREDNPDDNDGGDGNYGGSDGGEDYYATAPVYRNLSLNGNYSAGNISFVSEDRQENAKINIWNILIPLFLILICILLFVLVYVLMNRRK